MKQPFSIETALRRAEEALSKPPPLDWIERPEPRGELVARFVLPLELCKPQNQLTRAAMMIGANAKQIGPSRKLGNGKRGRSWQLGKYKTDVYTMMWAQHPPRRAPLPGRAFVRAIRFSPMETDPYADWAKAHLDILCIAGAGRKNRLNFIKDDKGSVCDIKQHWEPNPAGGPGFGYLEVWAGDPQWLP